MTSPASNKRNVSAVAYVAIGSNIDPAEYIPLALDLLRGAVDVVSVSQIYRSAALDRPEQADYRNGVVAIRTDFDPLALRDQVLRPIETRLGRERSADAYAARKIDLDLIVYGERVEDAEGLRLPDPDIRERPFVAVPLLEVAPDLILPDDGTSLCELAVSHDTVCLELDTELTEAVKGLLTV